MGLGFRVWGFGGSIGLGVQSLGAPGCRTYGASAFKVWGLGVPRVALGLGDGVSQHGSSWLPLLVIIKGKPGGWGVVGQPMGLTQESEGKV